MDDEIKVRDYIPWIALITDKTPTATRQSRLIICCNQHRQNDHILALQE